MKKKHIILIGSVIFVLIALLIAILVTLLSIQNKKNSNPIIDDIKKRTNQQATEIKNTDISDFLGWWSTIGHVVNITKNKNILKLEYYSSLFGYDYYKEKNMIVDGYSEKYVNKNENTLFGRFDSTTTSRYIEITKGKNGGYSIDQDLIEPKGISHCSKITSTPRQGYVSLGFLDMFKETDNIIFKDGKLYKDDEEIGKKDISMFKKNTDEAIKIYNSTYKRVALYDTENE